MAGSWVWKICLGMAECLSHIMTYSKLIWGWPFSRDIVSVVGRAAQLATKAVIFTLGNAWDSFGKSDLIGKRWKNPTPDLQFALRQGIHK